MARNKPVEHGKCRTLDVQAVYRSKRWGYLHAIRVTYRLFMVAYLCLNQQDKESPKPTKRVLRSLFLYPVHTLRNTFHGDHEESGQYKIQH